MSFSVTAMPEIEERITDDLDRITRSILSVTGNRTVAVILTGGYGRGEGGVCLRNGEMMPVNDYDLVVVVRDSSLHPFSHLRSRVRQLSRRLAEEIGVGVDLALVREVVLLSVKPTIFWYETRMGHQVLWGNPKTLDTMPKFDPTEIPLAEGAQLLLNRGAMLLDALVRVNGNGQPDNADIARILTAGWKAALSWGDCILLTQGEYHYSYRARESAFLGLPIQNGVPDEDRLKELYREAIRFKLSPDFRPPPNGDLGIWVNSIVRIHQGIFRWFEGVRLRQEFESWLEYVAIRKWPLTGCGEAAKRLFQNCSRFGPSRSFRTWGWLLSPPDGRLLSILPLLFEASGESLAVARKHLGGNGSWEDLSQRFLRAWQH